MSINPSGNIVLIENMVVATNLTYEVAVSLLEKANKSKCAKWIAFHISTETTSKSWKLVGQSIELRNKFLDNPQDFVIKE